MPTVSLRRVSPAQYEADAVVDALRDTLRPLGGIGAFVRPDERVVVKPNLVLGKHPDSAVTTHWTVLRAVVALLREAGVASIAIGDSPGFGDATHAAQTARFLDVCREFDAPWIAFTPVSVPRPGRPFPVLELARELVEADAVVNVAKLKTHGQMVLSLAMKNLFGAVPGYRKLQWHYRAGHDAAMFSRMLYEIYHAVDARLHVVDGIVGMDRLGPTAGRPVPVGLLAVGRDGASVDAVLADVLGFPRDRLPLLRAAREAGDTAFDEVETVGDDPASLRPGRFDIPRLRPPVMHGAWLEKNFPRLAGWLRNQLSAAPAPGAACVRCGVCAECCPAKAVDWTRGEAPRIDLRRCIRCYCCHELCPHHAMELSRAGWLGRRLRLGQPPAEPPAHP